MLGRQMTDEADWWCPMGPTLIRSILSVFALILYLRNRVLILLESFLAISRTEDVLAIMDEEQWNVSRGEQNEVEYATS